jgi:VIT1/CCC1 family predicted Fe2+/Mn2+ transporter
MEPGYSEKHYFFRSGWIRAGVLGANDGILSTASIIIGVAAANASWDPMMLAGVAGLVAGALSMAAGEYVSVSSQTDLEKSDLAREEQELLEMPEQELLELAQIYQNRGLLPETALEVARQLTAHDALKAHARDELGITEMTSAKPLQAAASSGIAFTFGGLLPVLVAFWAPLDQMVIWQYGFAIFFLVLLGIIAAQTSGSNPLRPVLRITFWGTLAMALTAGIGYLFDVGT